MSKWLFVLNFQDGKVHRTYIGDISVDDYEGYIESELGLKSSSVEYMVCDIGTVEDF